MSGAAARAETAEREAGQAKRKVERHEGTVEEMGKRMRAKRSKLVETQTQAAASRARADKDKFKRMNPLDASARRLPTSLQSDPEMVRLRDRRESLVTNAKIGPDGSHYNSTDKEFNKWLASTTNANVLNEALSRLEPLIRDEPKTVSAQKSVNKLNERLTRIATRKNRLASGDVQVSATTGLTSGRKKRKGGEKDKPKSKVFKTQEGGKKKVGTGFITKVKKTRKAKKKTPKPVKKPDVNPISRYFI